MDIKIINCQQGKLEINNENITDIVIFPVGHSDAVVGGPMGPLPISIDVDEEAFKNLKANTLSIHKDLSKLWSDFNHNGTTITSFLQDLIWNPLKGIVAKVKLTREGLAAADNRILNYFSPSFKIDANTNDLLSLCSCFGAFTDTPALQNLREYPITAMDKSNVYFNSLKRKKSMEIVTQKSITVDQIKVEAAKPTEPTTPTTELDEDDVVKAKKRLADAEAKVKKAEAYAEADAKKCALDEEIANKAIKPLESDFVKAEHTDEADDIKLFESSFLNIFQKYLPDIRKLLSGGVDEGAACKANDQLKALEDKINLINVEQCKVQDALTLVNKEDKEKILRATKPMNNIDMPGIKADEVIVNAQQASVKRLTPEDLMKHAKKIQRDQDVSFDFAWQQAKQIDLI